LRLILLVILVMVLLLPVAQAENEHVLEVFSPGVNSAPVALVHHTFPEAPVPKNALFYATLNIYSRDTDVTVDIESIHVHGGCTIDHFHNTTITARDEGTSMLINMAGADNCVWYLEGIITETGLGGGPRARFQVTGNVPSYTVQEFAQDPSDGISLIVPGFAWTLFILLSAHLRNWGTAFFSFIALLAAVVPGWPFSIVASFISVAIIGIPLDYFTDRERIFGPDKKQKGEPPL